MHYKRNIIINKPIDVVLPLIEDPDKMKEWQPGLESYEHISGDPGKVGAKMKLIYNQGKKKMEMVETILVEDGDYFEAQYETNGVTNIMKAKFTAVDSNSTRWETDNTFTFHSFFMKIIGFLFKGAFPKQTEKIMQQFKEYAESQ